MKDLSRLNPSTLSRPVKDPARALAEIELLSGGLLPSDYRQFLEQFGAPVMFGTGSIFEGREKTPWARDDRTDTLLVLYGLSGGEDSIKSNIKTYDTRMPAGFIPVGSSPAGNQICLYVHTGSRRGRVYYWDHENEVEISGDEGDYANIYLIANSFAEFMDRLRSQPEPDIENIDELFETPINLADVLGDPPKTKKRTSAK
jgi:hypothetical protein